MLVDMTSRRQRGSASSRRSRRRPPGAGAPPATGKAGGADVLRLRLDQAGGHVPVLAAELLAAVNPQPGQTIVDCTFGAGGHARLLAAGLGAEGTLVAIDRDPTARARFEELRNDLPCRSRFLAAPFADALSDLARDGVRADAVIFDLGISSQQVDTRERGFAYSYDAPLDMRMDPGQPLSARVAVAEWDERRLASTLRELGEERHARAIARAIVREREKRPIDTTQRLVEIVTAAMPAPARFGGGHPAKRAFQALRMAVNDELGQLERALPLAWELLEDGGVLAGISFHSIEDRYVKRFLAARARGCTCPPELPVCVCGHEPEASLERPVTPSAAEVAANPRAASARLRVARRIAPERHHS
jgi:16S rRNA (cytosine1402-N4)-methyltransferase